jgi:hypothetical protein
VATVGDLCDRISRLRQQVRKNELRAMLARRSKSYRSQLENRGAERAYRAIRKQLERIA